MSLKQWVNDKPTMDEFVKHLDDLIYLQHKAMEQAEDSITMYRAQGSVATLKKLKLLREQVNNG